jgi:hypothetical protein
LFLGRIRLGSSDGLFLASAGAELSERFIFNGAGATFSSAANNTDTSEIDSQIDRKIFLIVFQSQ